MSVQDKSFIVCIEYVNQEGGKVIGRSAPTTRKAAYRRMRQFNGLKKGSRAWVEKKPFKLTNQ